MATIKFWSEMTKATSVDGQDKVMIGKNSNGEAMYVDFQYLVNQAGAQASDYIPIDGNTLPTLGTENKFSIVGSGTYNQAVGGDVVVPENSLGIIVWDGDEWSVGSFVELPEPEIDKTNIIQEKSEKLTTETAVFSYSTPLTSERILPENDSFSHIDRPDLARLKETPLIITGEDDGIIGRVSKNSIIVTDTIDRPDIEGVIFTDENDVVVAVASQKEAGENEGDVNEEEVKEIIKESELINTFWEPPEQEGFSTGSSSAEHWLNYDYYADFDQVRVNQKIAQGYDPYITRELLGTSTKGDYNVYRYEFKPTKPTRKVILFGGTHGSEKIPPMVLLRFFKALCNDWMNDPTLMWARHNIHFVVIPLVSPFGMRHANRRVWETDPIPCSWNKSGDTVTVTFNESDFPTNNPNVSASDYFTASEGVAGNTWISLINSSDQNILPDDGYRIETVVNAQTVTIDVPLSGDGAGTCEIFVSTDPNRGFDLPSYPWKDNTTTNNKTTFSDPVAVPFNNKGTKPFALNESIFIRDTYELHSDATFAVDLHNGAGDYDTRHDPDVGIDPTPYLLNNRLHAPFTDEIMPIRIVVANTAGRYGGQLLGMSSFTIEWGELANTDERATDAQRWMSNFILICARFYNKKNN